MINNLIVKKHIQTSYKKTLFTYAYVCVFLILLLGYIIAFSIIKTNETRKIQYEKDLITLIGDTSQIKGFNLYLRLEEKGLNVIPFASYEVQIGDQNVLVIGTTNDYLDYLINDDGVYENESLVTNKRLDGMNIYSNNLAHSLFNEGSVAINDKSYTVVDSITFGTSPIIIMDYKTYSDSIEDISQELIDGGYVYNFKKLFVIKTSKDDIAIINDLLDVGKPSNTFTILTYQGLLDNNIKSTGINGTLSINLLWILCFLTLIIMTLIINLSINRRLEEFKLRFILGHRKKDLVIEVVVENTFYMSLLLLFLLIIGVVFSTVYSMLMSRTFIPLDFIVFITLFILPMVFNILISLSISIIRLSNTKLTKRRLT